MISVTVNFPCPGIKRQQRLSITSSKEAVTPDMPSFSTSKGSTEISSAVSAVWQEEAFENILPPDGADSSTVSVYGETAD